MILQNQTMLCDSDKTVFEFFAGGGMARLGLEPGWRTSFANDIDPQKAAAYVEAFGPGEMRLGDVASLQPSDLPGKPTLAWASFPCQDLSLAGQRGGFAAKRSSAFFGFWALIEALAYEGRAPRMIVLENVVGLLTSRDGADFAALAALLAAGGFRFGALVIDARWFLPQSRPRVFVVAQRGRPPGGLVAAGPTAPYHTPAVVKAASGLTGPAREAWTWWRMPPPPVPNQRLENILDEPPQGVCWNSPAKTARLIDLMSPLQRARLEALRLRPHCSVGALFRRVRREDGVRRQRVEVRFDGLAGCLRTPAGGSSRQSVMVIEAGEIRTRLLSPREAARLMGVPEDHPLPTSQTAALRLLGDGVCVPAVRWLSQSLLEPLARESLAPGRAGG